MPTYTVHLETGHCFKVKAQTLTQAGKKAYNTRVKGIFLPRPIIKQISTENHPNFPENRCIGFLTYTIQNYRGYVINETISANKKTLQLLIKALECY